MAKPKYYQMIIWWSLFKKEPCFYIKTVLFWSFDQKGFSYAVLKQNFNKMDTLCKVQRFKSSRYWHCERENSESKSSKTLLSWIKSPFLWWISRCEETQILSNDYMMITFRKKPYFDINTFLFAIIWPEGVLGSFICCIQP